MGCQCSKPRLGDNNELQENVIQLNRNGETTTNNDDKYNNYEDYPEKIVQMINKIRKNPKKYADIIEESMSNIEVDETRESQEQPRIIYKMKVRVSLYSGEKAFKQAAEELRNMEPMAPLIFKKEICIPLPENDEQFREEFFLRESVKEILKNCNINVYFKEMVKIPEVSCLLMIVDDTGKNSGKKRRAVLNKDFKYIGVNSKFFGKKFLAYFSFAKN